MCRALPILVLLLLAGCASSKNYQVTNPVLGPPPPRVARAQTEETQQAAESNVQTVSFEEKGPLSQTTVVARVDGRPILAGDVLESYAAKLKEFDTQLAMAVEQGKIDDATHQEHYRKVQEMLIRRDLPTLIEQTVLAERVKSKLKKEQLEAVNKQLDTFFEKEVENMKVKLKVSSTAELEATLQAHGSSLETMRKMFGDRQMAQQYIRTRVGEDPKPSRAEILAKYNSQIEKYEQPLQVKWQQLQITFNGSQDKPRAEAKIKQILSELKSGANLDDLVKQYSDGPLKENGGRWDWTQPASIANADVRAALEHLRAGEVSDILVGSTSLQIVKVLERREAGHQPLDEVQEDIRQQIINEFHESRMKQVMAEVMETAVIEKMFAEDPEAETIQ
jgi:parvulin-like peptidyl-prolyl isomerase